MRTISFGNSSFSEKKYLYRKLISDSRGFLHNSNMGSTINGDFNLKAISQLSKSSFSNRKNNQKSYKLLFNKNLTLKDSEFLSSIYSAKNYEDTEKDISLKYNITTDLSMNEKDKIKRIFKIKPNNKSISIISHQTEYGIEYSDPFNSKQVLNLNNDIYKTINNIGIETQYDQFQKKMIELSKKKHLLSLMPKIRISRITNIVNNITTKQISKQLSGKTTKTTKTTKTIKNQIEKKPEPINKLPIIKYQIKPIDKLKEDIVIFPGNIFTNFHPSSRVQFSYCISEKGLIYIFGGLQSKSFYDMWVCTIRKKSILNNENDYFDESEYLTWKKITKTKEEDCPLPRYGHSMTYHRDYIYIYGGNVNQNLLIRNREQSITIFDTKKELYYYPRCQNYKNVQWRRNHIGIGIGNNILIHGGINDNGDYLNDLWIFECFKFKWNHLSYKSLIKIPKIAFHSGVLVIKNQDILYHNDLNIYKFPEGSISKSKGNKIKIEGIYIYGGIDKEGNYYKDLWLIRIGVKPVDIINVPTKGKQPPLRTLCGMTFFSPLNLLVIYGGKNKFEILNDIWFFDLESLNWIKPVYKNDSFYPICGHCMFCWEEKIIFLGGNGENGLNKFDFNTIEFEIYNEKPEKDVIEDLLK